jgi:hypothetical protein
MGFEKVDFSQFSEANLDILKRREFSSLIYFNLFAEEEEIANFSFESPLVFGKMGYDLGLKKVFDFKLNEGIVEYWKEKHGLIELRIYLEKNDYFVLGKSIKSKFYQLFFLSCKRIPLIGFVD